MKVETMVSKVPLQNALKIKKRSDYKLERTCLFVHARGSSNAFVISAGRAERSYVQGGGQVC